MSIEDAVAAHYGHPGLAASVRAALKEAGFDPERLTPADLSGADEFHLGWHAATAAFADALAFPAGAHVLDIGCGVGGAARHMASARGLSVTGIDLSREFIDTARLLTGLCGLAGSVDFHAGSALALPFAPATFGGAYTIHAAMNIADKATLFAEARRVLKPGARLGIYDIMRAGAGALPYPMPWADGEATSFVVPPGAYRGILESAGFAVESERDQSDFVRGLIAERRAAAAGGDPRSPLQKLLGSSSPERSRNVAAALEGGLIAPTEIIARVV